MARRRARTVGRRDRDAAIALGWAVSVARWGGDRGERARTNQLLRSARAGRAPEGDGMMCWSHSARDVCVLCVCFLLLLVLLFGCNRWRRRCPFALVQRRISTVRPKWQHNYHQVYLNPRLMIILKAKFAHWQFPYV